MKCDSYPVLQALYLTRGGGGRGWGGGWRGMGEDGGGGGGEVKRFNAPHSNQCLYDKFLDLYDKFQLSS
jgi:hypothetical protein